jgi:hypothetical protein
MGYANDQHGTVSRFSFSVAAYGVIGYSVAAHPRGVSLRAFAATEHAAARLLLMRCRVPAQTLVAALEPQPAHVTCGMFPASFDTIERSVGEVVAWTT